jgi:hypothetical protein
VRKVYSKFSCITVRKVYSNLFTLTLTQYTASSPQSNTRARDLFSLLPSLCRQDDLSSLYSSLSVGETTRETTTTQLLSRVCAHTTSVSSFSQLTGNRSDPLLALTLPARSPRLSRQSGGTTASLATASFCLAWRHAAASRARWGSEEAIRQPTRLRFSDLRVWHGSWEFDSVASRARWGHREAL